MWDASICARNVPNRLPSTRARRHTSLRPSHTLGVSCPCALHTSRQAACQNTPEPCARGRVTAPLCSTVWGRVLRFAGSRTAETRALRQPSRRGSRDQRAAWGRGFALHLTSSLAMLARAGATPTGPRTPPTTEQQPTPDLFSGAHPHGPRTRAPPAIVESPEIFWYGVYGDHRQHGSDTRCGSS